MCAWTGRGLVTPLPVCMYKYGKRRTGGTNHGKKPRKFNQDCTICHSCRQADI